MNKMIPYPLTSQPKPSNRLINTMAKPLTIARQAPARTAAPKPGGPVRRPGKPAEITGGLGPDVVKQAPEVPAATDISYGDGSSYQDPAIAQMQAMAARAAAIAARTREAAQAEAAAKTKQATIEYGDATGVPGIDAATAQAAANNPFSILAALQRNYTQGVGELEDQLNKANLFYGGYRGQQLGQAATNYQQQRYGAGTRYQATLADINSALTQALLNADMMEMQAGGGGGGGGGDEWPISVGKGGDTLHQGIEGALIAKPYNFQKSADIQYATPTSGDTANQGGWVRDGSGWYSPVYGIRVDENGRIR